MKLAGEKKKKHEASPWESDSPSHVQSHSCGTGGCVGCCQPPRSTLMWRAGNQSLWCLVLSPQIDKGSVCGGCCSTTSSGPFEVLEQLFSSCCESGRADTDAALGHGHQARWVSDGFVPSGFLPHHPWVSRLWRWVGGWVWEHISDPRVHLPWVSLWLWQGGVQVLSSISWDLDNSLVFWASILLGTHLFTAFPLCPVWHTSVFLSFHTLPYLLYQTLQPDFVFKASMSCPLSSLIPSSNLPNTSLFFSLVWSSNKYCCVFWWTPRDCLQIALNVLLLIYFCCKRALGSG